MQAGLEGLVMVGELCVDVKLASKAVLVSGAEVAEYNDVRIGGLIDPLFSDPEILGRKGVNVWLDDPFVFGTVLVIDGPGTGGMTVPLVSLNDSLESSVLHGTGLDIITRTPVEVVMATPDMVETIALLMVEV